MTAEREHCAAAWFVRLDSGTVDTDTDREFAEWMSDDMGREAEFARCEAAMCVAGRLRSEPDMRWAYEEIEPFLAGGALARRWISPRRWLSAPRALAATGASIVLALLGAFLFSMPRTELLSVPGGNEPALLGDTLAPEDERLETEVSLPSPGERPQSLEKLLELVAAGRAQTRFDRFPLDELIVRGLIVVRDPTSPRSRVIVVMPDGTIGYAGVGDHLGEEHVRITEITSTAVVLEDGTRIALGSPEGN